jgi:hypothetical protein
VLASWIVALLGGGFVILAGEKVVIIKVKRVVTAVVTELIGELLVGDDGEAYATEQPS